MDRKSQIAWWGLVAALALTNLVINVVTDGDLWLSALWVAGAVPMLVQMWNGFTRRIEADSTGLRLHELLSKDRVIPWSDISEIRPNATGAWGSHLVVVLHDGEVVRLPLAATEHGPVERWQQETHA